MNKELEFLLIVTRNGVILAGLYFFSIYASNEVLSYAICKPIIIFLATYILTELARRYGIAAKNPQQLKNLKTLIW